MAAVSISHFCDGRNVTYSHRVFDPDAHNFCAVPGGGADALLFAGLAVFFSCALYSQLSAIWVLLAGVAYQTLSVYFNLGHFTNAITIWLGMHPATIFFQIFLPPLLLDSAVRIDFFLFKKMAAHCFSFAFVNVVLSTLTFVPFMLKGLGLAATGWRPVDAALFGAVLGSTDAVAVAAILKAGGAPEMLSVLLEGESLFNDASSIVLFEIFLELGLKPGAADMSLREHAGEIMRMIAWLAGSGAAAGLAMGVLAKLMLWLLQRRSVPPYVEVSVSLAGAYSVYLLTEYYIDGSGVIAVVVYGLYGASTFLWGFSSKGMRQGAFFKFWDVVSFVTNGMVFFFVGASITNFFIRLTPELFAGGSAGAALQTVRTVPAVIAATFGLRWVLMTLEAPLLSLVGPALSWRDVLFSTVGGLRGGLALILAQTLLATHSGGSGGEEQLTVVHAEMVIWVSGVVLFTLLVNAPLLGPLMTVLGLNQTTAAQRHMHRHASRCLAAYTRQTIEDLKADDDEMLRGVDWAAVERGADLGKAVRRVLRSASTGAAAGGGGARDSAGDGAGGGGGGGAGGGRTVARQLSSLLDAEELSSVDGRLSAAAPEGPLAQLRASLTRASMSFRRRAAGALAAPLLNRRYGAADGASDDGGGGGGGAGVAAGDVEAGVPQVIPESASEAVFIASRVQRQDAQLAELAEGAQDGPLLARNTPQAAERAAAEAEAAGHEEEDEEEEEDDEEDEPASLQGGSEEGEGQELSFSAAGAGKQGDAGAAAAGTERAAAAAEPGPRFHPLQPLVVVRMVDALRVRRGQHVRGAIGQAHSAVTAAWAGGAGGGAAAAAAQPGSSGGPSGLRRSSVHALSAVWRQRVPAQSVHDPIGGRLAPAATAAAPPPSLLQGSCSPRSSTRASGNGLGAGLGTVGADANRLLQHFDAMSELSDEDDEEYLEECRVSLLAGLKRYFRHKAAEGLLSRTGLRMLDYACDANLSRPGRPLNLWSAVSRDIENRGLTGWVASMHYALRRYKASLLRSASESWSSYVFHLFVARPLNRLSLMLRNQLGNTALTVLEVALELWLALTASPQARLIRDGTSMASGMLQEELREQADTVWRFIQDRQIEAPDEFASLQTHRAQLAVARRQLAFVEQLAEVGGVEEAAAEALHEAVERRLQKLENRGPSWRSPSLADVLRRQPFLANEGEGLLLWLRAYGELKSYAPGQCIVPRRRTGPLGIFIVLSGLVRVEMLRGGGQETHFVGVGGSVGFVSSLLGQELAGVGLVAAFAQGNALGRGPLVLHLPMRLLQTIRQRAEPAMARAAPAQPPPAHDAQRQEQRSPFSVFPSAPGGGADGAAGAAGADADAAELTSLLSLPPASALSMTGTLSELAAPAQLNAAAFAQLYLDMHRQAGVMLLDRMGDGLARQLVAHVEAAMQAIQGYCLQLPAPQSGAKFQRLSEALLGSPGGAAAVAADLSTCSLEVATAAAAAALGSGGSGVEGPPGAGAGGGGGGGDDIAGEAAAIVRLVADRAVAAAVSLRFAMRAADLVSLAPGHRISPCSSIMLMRGSLRLPPQACSGPRPAAAGAGGGRPPSGAPAGGAAAAGGRDKSRSVSAPAMLAWGPELFPGLEDRYDRAAPALQLTAGSKGALLLVAPSTIATVVEPAAEQPAGVHGADGRLQWWHDAHPPPAPGVGGAAAGGSGEEQQQGGQRRFTRLSSVVPLRPPETLAAGLGGDAV